MRLAVSILCLIVLLVSACGSTGGQGTNQSTSSVIRVTTVTNAEETTTTTARATATTGAVTTSSIAESTTTTTLDIEHWIAQDGPVTMALVEEYYGLLNTGDVEAALDMIAGFLGENFRENLTMAVDGANARFATDCSISETEPVVRCRETISDDLYGPAGIALTGGMRYTVAVGESDQLTLRFDGPPACTSESYTNANYLLDLYDWVVGAHSILRLNFTGDLSMGELGIPCTAYPFPTAELAIEVCEVVPEFLAQSDKYPITTP